MYLKIIPFIFVYKEKAVVSSIWCTTHYKYRKMNDKDTAYAWKERSQIVMSNEATW